MLSPELYEKGADKWTPADVIEATWEEIGAKHAIQAGLVVRIDQINNSLKVVSLITCR